MKTLIISNHYELFSYLFSDIGKTITYPYDDFENSRKAYNLWRITHSRKLHYPFRGLWNRFLLAKWKKEQGIVKIKTIIFLNTGLYSEYLTDDYLNYLKKRKIRLILFLVDSIEHFDEIERHRIIHFTAFFDRVFTFDLYDAAKHCFQHSYCYYSKLSVPPKGDQTDVLCVFYAGNNNRLELAVKLWDKLQSYGLKCYFSVVGVTDEMIKQYSRKGMLFNRYCNYAELIGRVLQTNIIVEIVQENQHGNTLRAFEAVVYNKKLLTNYAEITDFPYYDPYKMKYYMLPEDLDYIERRFWNIEKIEYNYQNDFSPVHLLEM